MKVKTQLLIIYIYNLFFLKDKNEDSINTSGGLGVSECSNSSWAEMESYVIASSSIYPLTLAAKQVLILRYLTPMGEYQEVNQTSQIFQIIFFFTVLELYFRIQRAIYYH